MIGSGHVVKFFDERLFNNSLEVGAVPALQSKIDCLSKEDLFLQFGGNRWQIKTSVESTATVNKVKMIFINSQTTFEAGIDFVSNTMDATGYQKDAGKLPLGQCLSPLANPSKAMRELWAQLSPIIREGERIAPFSFANEGLTGKWINKRLVLLLFLSSMLLVVAYCLLKNIRNFSYFGLRKLG